MSIEQIVQNHLIYSLELCFDWMYIFSNLHISLVFSRELFHTLLTKAMTALFNHITMTNIESNVQVWCSSNDCWSITSVRSVTYAFTCESQTISKVLIGIFSSAHNDASVSQRYNNHGGCNNEWDKSSDDSNQPCNETSKWKECSVNKKYELQGRLQTTWTYVLSILSVYQIVTAPCDLWLLVYFPVNLIRYKLQSRSISLCVLKRQCKWNVWTLSLSYYKKYHCCFVTSKVDYPPCLQWILDFHSPPFWLRCQA